MSAAEQEELENLLKAKVLTRSPSVLRVAEYIGRKYLEGEARSLKEYNIAVEALGKPLEFDPKRDSIVRVEAHRLRKKLDQYYRSEGSHHALRMVIEPGQYAPKFLPNQSSPAVECEAPQPALEAEPALEPIESAGREMGGARGSRALRTVVGVAFAVCAMAAAVWLTRHFRPASEQEPIRFICGVPAKTVLSNNGGFSWPGDAWGRGGEAVWATASDPAWDLPDLPANVQRQGDSDYAIPVQKGPLELRLYFAPRLPSAAHPTPGRGRAFEVRLNGERVLDALDPGMAQARPDRSMIKVFRDVYPERDGKVHLSLRSGADPAYINAIELTRGEPGRLVPIRLIARASRYDSPSGVVWSHDHDYYGGKLVARGKRITGSLDPNLFVGERFGAFEYQIPVTPGAYALKLYFAETWFGPGSTPGGVGSRRFDVQANGIPLLSDFDIFREAGGNFRPVVKEFHNLRPDAAGYINLAFVPRVNWACVNALELSQEPGSIVGR